jgi:hypothetical protein
MQANAAAVAGSTELRVAFVALTLLVAALLVLAVYYSSLGTGLDARKARLRAGTAASLTTLWLTVTGIAASRGALHFEPPPTMLPVFLMTFAIAIGLALSPVGKRIAIGLPIAALVGYQAFRVLVELLLHRAYREGLMPVQMSFSGRNFDIVSGITAVLLGAWLVVRPTLSRRLVFAWNTLGLALLINIIGVALLSAPTPLRVFMNEPANVWITHTPWVWLPTVMVLAALCGHLVVYRRLAIEARVPRPAQNDDGVSLAPLPG